MSHLTQAMVEQFFEVEKKEARCVMRKEMDSCMETIFKQMKQKLMMLVESQDVKTETVEGDLSTHLLGERQQHSSSNDISQIRSTSTHSHVQDNDSQHNDDDEIILKNELSEIIDIVPDGSIPPSSTQPSNEQSNDYDILFDYLDEEEEDCDCPDCVGNICVKNEMNAENEELEQDEAQLIENPGDNLDNGLRPAKRLRIEETQNQSERPRPNPTQLKQAQPNNQPNRNQSTTSHVMTCLQCLQMFQDKKSFEQHLKDVHSIGSNHSNASYQCKFKDCSQTFNKKMDLGHHYRTSHRELTYSHIPGCTKKS